MAGQISNLKSQIENLLTPAQVAEVAAVSPDTVRGWIADGRLPAINVSRVATCCKPRFRVRLDDLETFLLERTTTPPPPPRLRVRPRGEYKRIV